MMDGVPEVSFPIGVALPQTDDEARLSIWNLLRVIQRSSKSADFLVGPSPADLGTQEGLQFPLNAMVYMLLDYFEHEYSTLHSWRLVSSSKGPGRIDWARTFKTSRSMVLPSGRLAFEEPIFRRPVVDDDSILTSIHRHCLALSFQRVGWLFTSQQFPQFPLPIAVQSALYEIDNAYSRTFNLDQQALLSSMRSILKYVDAPAYDRPGTYGTNNFELVWERAVDFCFANRSRSQYSPRATWSIGTETFSTRKPLEPDSILAFDDILCVIDAKYYSFGHTSDFNNLPGSSDIAKQVEYGRYAREISGGRRVLNIFILPFEGTAANPIEYVGHASMPFQQVAHGFERVHAYLVSSNLLFSSYLSGSTVLQDRLVKDLRILVSSTKFIPGFS